MRGLLPPGSPNYRRMLEYGDNVRASGSVFRCTLVCERVRISVCLLYSRISVRLLFKLYISFPLVAIDRESVGLIVTRGGRNNLRKRRGRRGCINEWLNECQVDCARLREAAEGACQSIPRSFPRRSFLRHKY